MSSRLPELPSEIQEMIMGHVCQLEERDKVVAHLDGLLDDVVSCLGMHNNAGVSLLHQMLDVWDVSGPV